MWNMVMIRKMTISHFVEVFHAGLLHLPVDPALEDLLAGHVLAGHVV